MVASLVEGAWIGFAAILWSPMTICKEAQSVETRDARYGFLSWHLCRTGI